MRRKTQYGNRGNERWRNLSSVDYQWRMVRGIRNYDRPLWYTNEGLREQKRIMRERL